MPDLIAEAVAPVAAPPSGPVESPGQGAAPTPTATDNQPASDATPSGQAPAPAPSTPKYRFKDQTEAERAHSELQRRYSRVGDPDQAANALGLLQSLQADPDFVEWAKARLAKQEAGSGDPQTVQAVEIVKNLARQEAQQLVAPYAAQAAAANRAAVYQAMTQKYPDWREHQQAMAEVLKEGLETGFLARQPPMNLKFMETLYHAATARDPEHAAKAYAKKLAAKHATATQATPGPAPSAVSTGRISSFEDAYAAAKRQNGIA